MVSETIDKSQAFAPVRHVVQWAAIVGDTRQRSGLAYKSMSLLAQVGSEIAGGKGTVLKKI